MAKSKKIFRVEPRSTVYGPYAVLVGDTPIVINIPSEEKANKLVAAFKALAKKAVEPEVVEVPEDFEMTTRITVSTKWQWEDSGGENGPSDEAIDKSIQHSLRAAIESALEDELNQAQAPKVKMVFDTQITRKPGKRT